MTECVYQRPITSFAVEMKPQPVFEVDILAEGRAALERANRDLGGSVTLSKLPLCLLFLFTVFSRVLMCCNLHPSFLSFPTSAGFCCSCEYTVSTYSCHMTLFINRLESQDSSGAAHYLTRACLLVSEVMWEQIFKKIQEEMIWWFFSDTATEAALLLMLPASFVFWRRAWEYLQHVLCRPFMLSRGIEVINKTDLCIIFCNITVC